MLSEMVVRGIPKAILELLQSDSSSAVRTRALASQDGSGSSHIAQTFPAESYSFVKDESASDMQQLQLSS